MPKQTWEEWAEKRDILPKATASVWMPISTAPKDGTLILIRERCGRVQVAKWDCPDGYAFDWYVQLTNWGTNGYPTIDVIEWTHIPK